MVDKSRSRKEGGAGIGMALCQRIVQIHKAVLKINSTLGEGTVMQIRFPGDVPTLTDEDNAVDLSETKPVKATDD